MNERVKAMKQVAESIIEEANWADNKHCKDFESPVVKTTVVVNLQRCPMRVVLVPDKPSVWKHVQLFAEAAGCGFEEIGEEYYQDLRK